MKKTYKKSYFIHMYKVYKTISFSLLVAILLMGVVCGNVYGIKKCKKVKVVKKEIINQNVVFLGDSITDYYNLDNYYPNLKKVNSGISGDKTKDILSDMYNRVYRYNPSKVVLLIGINDILHNEDSDYIIDDIKKMTDEIHKNLPECEILIQSIYPINKDCEEKHSIISDYKSLNEKVIKNNDKIKELCEEKNYTYIDMFLILSDEDGFISKEYSDDGLHPNENAYKKITKIIKKYL